MRDGKSAWRAFSSHEKVAKYIGKQSAERLEHLQWPGVQPNPD
jgi:hypothetical protein